MPSQERLAIAFAMTAGAGLATSIGAATVFLPDFDDKKYLGISLAFAAGVMLYVSFVEIFIKSYDAFVAYFDNQDGVDTSVIAVDDYEPSTKAYYCTTATFFFGILLTAFLDYLIHILNDDMKDAVHNQPKLPLQQNVQIAVSDAVDTPDTDSNDLEAATESTTHVDPTLTNHNLLGGGSQENLDRFLDDRSTSYVSAITSRAAVSSAHPVDEKDRRLMRMALVTGLAIALHNFPEGLATFVASAQEPANGAPIAIAIGVHNIPEGICVAAPIFHATGSRKRAFFWGTVSGLAETLAGAIGWIIFSHREDDMGWLAYAILFGLVAGMMTFISFSELIVTALEYDTERKYFMPVLTLGMLIMALSLMIFQEA